MSNYSAMSTLLTRRVTPAWRWLLPIVAFGLVPSARGGDSASDLIEQAGAAITDATSGDSNDPSEGDSAQSAPDGLPGQLVKTLSQVTVSRLNINVFRSGTR